MEIDLYTEIQSYLIEEKYDLKKLLSLLSKGDSFDSEEYRSNLKSQIIYEAKEQIKGKPMLKDSIKIKVSKLLEHLQ